MRKLFLIITMVVLLLLVACAKKNTAVEDAVINDYGYIPIKVDFLNLYQNQTAIYNHITYATEDADGVPLFANAGHLYYHPVMIGHHCLWALSDYVNTHDERYLNYTIKCIRALLVRATREGNCIYFPYQFDFSSSANNMTINYYAPWYSGMAQGVLLSVLSRIYYITQDSYYHAVADSVLNTFDKFNNSNSTVYISKNESLGVKDNYYWVDEYPNSIRRFVLNGSISGSFGLYDHWWVFGDDRSRVLFSREMTSIKDHVLLYRNPMRISYYCLKLKEQSLTYHSLHQLLLNYCFLYTGDQFFSVVSYLFFNDYH